MPRVALAIFIVALWIYGIIDCVRTPRSSMPGRLPKWLWVLLTLVPVLGSILWLVLSWSAKHPEGLGDLNLGPRRQATPARPVAPDDDPEFLAKLDARNRFAEWERRQARKTSEDESDDPGDATAPPTSDPEADEADGEAAGRPNRPR